MSPSPYVSSRHALLALALAGVILSGCDATSSSDFEEEIVVEAYLQVGDRLPQVRVSRTVPAGETYVFEENAVTDASVRILLLDAAGAVEAAYAYLAVGQEPGVYRPSDVALVQEARTYRLEVDVPGQARPVTATTVVPGAFLLVQANADTIVYQGASQLELDVTRSVYPGRQSIYIFSTEALDLGVDMLTPFYRDIIDDDDDIADLRITNSPLINEGNYVANDDGTITIRLPWIAVAFYGRNRLTASALDDNLFDFFRTQSVQQGGSTFSPGEIPNVIEHIDGGTGVFGSYANSSFEVVIVPRSAP